MCYFWCLSVCLLQCAVDVYVQNITQMMMLTTFHPKGQTIENRLVRFINDYMLILTNLQLLKDDSILSGAFIDMNYSLHFVNYT